MSDTINEMRELAGLGPVTEEKELSEGNVNIGMEILGEILPLSEIRKIGKMSDEQTGKLAMDTYRQLCERIGSALGNEGKEAINRLLHKSNYKKDDAGMTRNNIFKAAHALGVRLPSMSF